MSEEERPAETADAPAEETAASPAPEEAPAEVPAAAPLPADRAHFLWRGWWLAVLLLGCFVLMGWSPAPGVAWLQQPLRAFAGAVFLGGCAASLPGILKGRKPDKPAWKRCLLALACGALWGVLA